MPIQSISTVTTLSAPDSPVETDESDFLEQAQTEQNQSDQASSGESRPQAAMPHTGAISPALIRVLSQHTQHGVVIKTPHDAAVMAQVAHVQQQDAPAKEKQAIRDREHKASLQRAEAQANFSGKAATTGTSGINPLAFAGLMG